MFRVRCNFWDPRSRFLMKKASTIIAFIFQMKQRKRKRQPALFIEFRTKSLLTKWVAYGRLGQEALKDSSKSHKFRTFSTAYLEKCGRKFSPSDLVDFVKPRRRTSFFADSFAFNQLTIGHPHLKLPPHIRSFFSSKQPWDSGNVSCYQTSHWPSLMIVTLIVYDFPA